MVKVGDNIELDSYKEVAMTNNYMKINLTELDNFNIISDRYIELISNDTDRISQIYTCRLVINFAIQDINQLIDKLNEEKFQRGDFYELIVKGYQILGTIGVLTKTDQNLLKAGYDELYGKENTNKRDKIDYFRGIRSLTSAHPLETTESTFEKFGFGKNIWLEDLDLGDTFIHSFRNMKGDIFLHLKKANEEVAHYKSLFYEEDILAPIRIMIEQFTIINKNLKKYIQKQEKKLRSEPILLPENINEQWLSLLREAILERYSAEIELIKYDSTFLPENMPSEEEFWEVKNYYNFLLWTPKFGDERDTKVQKFQEIKHKELLEYINHIQNMTLTEESKLSFNNAKCPKEIDLYADSKIHEYLNHSKAFSASESLKLLEQFSVSQLTGSEKVTNTQWGIIQLKTIENIIRPYFEIDWKRSDQEIYWQYQTALFLMNKN